MTKCGRKASHGRTAEAGWGTVAAVLMLCALAGCDNSATDKPPLTKTVALGSTPDRKEQAGARTFRPPEAPRRRVPARNGATPLATASPGKRSARCQLAVTGTVVLADASPATSASLEVVRVCWEDYCSTLAVTRVATAASATDGSFRIVCDHGPELWLRTSFDGYATEEMRLTGNAQNENSRETPRELEKRVALQPAARLAGIIRDEDGAPIANATITAAHVERWGESTVGSSTTSSLDGRFELADLHAGNTDVWVVSPSHVRQGRIVQVPADRVEFRLARVGAIVEGRTVLKTTGEPVSSATVGLYFSESVRAPRSMARLYHTNSDVLGRFRFERLPEGHYYLDAERKPLRLLDSSVGRRTDAESNHEIWLRERETTSGMVLSLFPGYTVSGRTVDVETSQPLEGVRIQWGEGQDAEMRTVETTASGTFRITGLLSMKESLLVEKPGWCLASSLNPGARVSQPVSIDRGNLEQMLDIAMCRSLTVSGTVRSDLGGAVCGATVQPSSEVGERHKMPPCETGADGSFSFAAFPQTRYRLRITSRDYPTTVTDIIKVGHTPVSGIQIVLQPGGTLRGTVTDPNGRLIEGARVRAISTVLADSFDSQDRFWALKEVADGDHEAAGETMSGPNGGFEIRNLPAGTLLVLGRKTGYARNRLETIELESGKIRADCRIVLRRQGFVSGTVTDSATQPVPGAEVYAFSKADGPDGQHGSAKTDASGFYRIDELAETTLTLWAQQEGYEYVQREISGIDREHVDFRLESLKSGTVIGTVVDWKTLLPVASFEVRARDGKAKPEKDNRAPGRFVMKGLKEQEYVSVEVLAEGYLKELRGFRLEPGEKEKEIRITLEPGSTLRGRVVSKGDRIPVSGAALSVHGGMRTASYIYGGYGHETRATTGADGRFEVKGVGAGYGMIGIRQTGSSPVIYHPYKAKNAETTDLGDIEIGDGATVKVQVVRMPGSKLAAGVLVQLDDQSFNTRQGVTGEDGEAVFSGLRPGNVYVQLPDRNTRLDSNIAVVDGETRSLRVTLGGSALKGTVVRGTDPVPWANITARLGNSLHSCSMYARTDKDGAFTLEDLSSGSWRITVSPDQEWSCRVTEYIEIGNGDTIERTFVLPSGRIAGRVVNAKDEPVAGASVGVKVRDDSNDELPQNRPTGTNVQAPSLHDGRFVLEGLPAGSYLVEVGKEGVGRAVARDVVAKMF